VIEVNPEPTPLTPHAHVSLRGKAAELLPALEQAAA
jgi:NAD-dependent SIR2 family protein deacetylase